MRDGSAIGRSIGIGHQLIGQSMPAPSRPTGEKVHAGPREKKPSPGLSDSIAESGAEISSFSHFFPGLIGLCRPRRKTYRSTGTARINSTMSRTPKSRVTKALVNPRRRVGRPARYTPELWRAALGTGGGISWATPRGASASYGPAAPRRRLDACETISVIKSRAGLVVGPDGRHCRPRLRIAEREHRDGERRVK
jgi:hypothetical protein